MKHRHNINEINALRIELDILNNEMIVAKEWIKKIVNQLNLK